MRFFISGAALAISLVFFAGSTASAAFDFTITPNGTLLGPVMEFADIEDAENKIKKHPDKLINNNNDIIPYGLALGNTIGYPNGKSIIPNYEAGIAAGGAAYKYDRYDKEKGFDKEDPKIPGGGFNAAIHFGMGLSKETDITFKMSVFKKWMYAPKVDLKEESEEYIYDFKLDRTDFVSLGVKGRYNLVEQAELIPYVLSFGGVTAGVALDFLHGRASTSGSYTDIRDIEFQRKDILSGENFSSTQTVLVETVVNGKADFEWNVISVTPEIMVYADFLYFLTLYTGPAVSLNAGSANFSLSAEGTLKNRTALYGDEASTWELAPAGSTIASGVLRANEPFDVPAAIPLWKLGVEINILAFKIQVEGATVLTSPKNSFTAQAGLRVQF